MWNILYTTYASLAGNVIQNNERERNRITLQRGQEIEYLLSLNVRASI